MKYAVVETGGKQYIAREGEMIEVDRLPLDVGKPVELKDVLLIVDGSSIQVGSPLVKGASVKGEVFGQIKAKKIIVFKYIPKERYRRKQGHRQRYTQIRIKEIVAAAPKSSAAAKAEAPQAEKQTVKRTAKKSTSKPAASKAKKSAEKTKATGKASASAKSKSEGKGAAKPKASGSGKKSASKRSSTSSKKSSGKKASSKKEE